MATLTQLYDLVNGKPQLFQRFLAARMKTSWDVLNEATTTPNHTARTAWANKIVANFTADADSEYRRFLSNTTIQSLGDAATDNDILFTISSMLDSFASFVSP